MHKIINKECKPLRDSLGLATMLENERGDTGIVTQQVEAFLECFVAKFEQHFPLYWRESAEKASYCLLEMLQNTKKCQRKILFLHRNFLHKIFSKYNN
jgi:hypothetical protein